MYISVSSQTTLQNPANFFAFALYDASAPTVLLETVTPAKPYGNPLQISFTFNCISGHIYIIKLWESANGTATGVVRNSFSQAVNAFSILVRLPEYLEADITPGLVSGATSYVDPTLAGWDYWIERVGSGTITPDFAPTTNPVYHKDTDGFTLIQAGDNFQPNEKFNIFFIPQAVPLAPGAPSPTFSSARIVTADEVFTNADIGTALILQSATTSINTVLPPVSGMPDFSWFYIYSNGGNHKNASIAATAGDVFYYTGNKSKIVLGQGEVLRCYKAFGKLYIDNDLFGAKAVGEVLYNYFQSELNTLLMDGREKNRADYPRLWSFIQTLDAGVVVSDTAWNSTTVIRDGITYYTKKGCFSTGDGSTTFRLPLLTNQMLKGVDGSIRLIGSLEIESTISHAHATPHSTSNTPGGTGYIGGSAAVYQAGLDLTDGLRDGATGVPLQRAGSKNIVDNIGAYCLIRC